MFISWGVERGNICRVRLYFNFKTKPEFRGEVIFKKCSVVSISGASVRVYGRQIMSEGPRMAKCEVGGYDITD